MSYRNKPNEIIEVEFTEISPAQRTVTSGLVPRRTRAMMGKVVEEAMVLDTHDKCLAMLAKAGMEHTAALSVLEQQFSRMTPQAAARYREIVEAYAQKAADKIWRW